VVVTRIRDDDGPVYTVEWCVFVTLGKVLHVTHTIWVYEGSLLHRWLAARAR
jgi:hypothetical protein